MVKEQKTIGLSRDFIIHPGETLEEIIDDLGMSQRELSVRTGVTEKHISTVIHGQKNISAAFAKKLEYALGIESSFWMNLQVNYDRELLAFEELNGISEAEIGLLKNLKEVVECWTSFGWIEEHINKPSLILDLRNILNISDLTNVPKIAYTGSYRVQLKKATTDPYVLFAWQRMCELLTKNIDIAQEVDIEKLRASIPLIKETMFEKASDIQPKLVKILAECGIAFQIVPNFKGAPVQGFIKKKDNRLIMCITLRQKFADIFWFTLFHEIAHILNGDTDNIFIDVASISNKMENAADQVARSILINEDDYRNFVESKDYLSANGIARFAETQNVRDFIVKGRLMKDTLVPWGDRLKYEWA